MTFTKNRYINSNNGNLSGQYTFFLVKIVLSERVTKNVLRLQNNTQFESFFLKVRQQGRYYFISFLRTNPTRTSLQK